MQSTETTQQRTMLRFLSSSIRRIRIFEALCLTQGIHCPISNKPRDAILINNFNKQQIQGL